MTLTHPKQLLLQRRMLSELCNCGMLRRSRQPGIDGEADGQSERAPEMRLDS